MAKAQIILLQTEDLIKEVRKTYEGDEAFLVQFVPYETEIKKAKNISNIGKIEEVGRAALLFAGEQIMKDEKRVAQGKAIINTINKLIKKAGGSKKFTIEKKKQGKSITTQIQEQQKKLTKFLSTGTKNKKNDEFSRLKGILAKKKYMQEVRTLIKNMRKNGIQETLLRLQAIEERLIEL